MDKNPSRTTLRRILRLYALYAKMDLAWLLRDTGFALMVMGTELIGNIAAISGMVLLAARFSGIGSMSEAEVLLLTAFSTCCTGLLQLLFGGGNISFISRRIGRGQLEHMLIMPLPLPAQLAVEGFIPFSGCGNFLSGLALTAYALHRLELAPTPRLMLVFAGSMLVSVLLLLCCSYLFGSLAFWFPVAAEELSDEVLTRMGELAPLPLSGLSACAILPLITVLPTGLIAWFPTLALLGRAPLGLPQLLPLSILLLFFLLAKHFFQRGLMYHVTHGNNRYLPHGHRR